MPLCPSSLLDHFPWGLSTKSNFSTPIIPRRRTCEASKTKILARMAWGFVASAMSTQESLQGAGVSGPPSNKLIVENAFYSAIEYSVYHISIFLIRLDCVLSVSNDSHLPPPNKKSIIFTK